MAVISDYASLQTAVTDYVARTDLASFTPNFIQNWEERFYREPMNYGYWMEADLDVTIASGAAALPADYLRLKVAYLSGQNSAPLQIVPLDLLYARFPPASSSGMPMYIARSGSSLVFGPAADAAYEILGKYYAKPALLRNDSDGINWLITNAPDLCLYGALLEAEPFLKNDYRLPVWAEFYKEALAAYRSQMRDFSGGALQVRAA